MRALFVSLTLVLTTAMAAGCAGEDCTTANGTVIADGESGPADDGCNTCTCDDGALACTEIACADSGDSGT